MKNKNAPKPRNPYIQHLVAKKQGAHTKTVKSIRAEKKRELKKASYDDSYMIWKNISV